MIQIIFILSVIIPAGAFARPQNSCDSMFVSQKSETEAKTESYYSGSRNSPLIAIMKTIRDNELAMQEFTQKLRAGDSVRNEESLNAVLAIAKKNLKLFDYLAEKASTSMMTPKITVKTTQKEQFVINYQKAYVDYGKIISKFVEQLQTFQTLNPKDWSFDSLNDLILEMHTAMGNAHNRF